MMGDYLSGLAPRLEAALVSTEAIEAVAVMIATTFMVLVNMIVTGGL